MIDKKLFSLTFIDDRCKQLNLRSFDGDKPTLSGVSLTSCDSNFHQHGMNMFTHVYMDCYILASVHVVNVLVYSKQVLFSSSLCMCSFVNINMPMHYHSHLFPCGRNF